MPHNTILDCKHDPHDPDHIVCMKREGKRKSKHPFVAYIDDRYDRFYHPRHVHTHIHRTVDSLLVISITLLIGFFMFSLVQKPSSGIQLGIHAPEHIRIGEETSFEITYQNTEHYDIRNAHLELTLPDNFELKEPLKSDIGLIPKGARGQIVFHGIPFGAIGEEQSIIASLRGIHSKENIEEQSATYTRYAPVSSVIETRMSFPKTVALQQLFTTLIHVKNTAGHPVNDIRVAVEIPKGFITSPAREKNNHISSLAAGEERTIQFEGRFMDAPPKEQMFNVKTYLKKSGKEFLQSQSEQSISLTQQNLILSLAQQGAVKDILPNKETSITLSWKNNSNISLSKLTLGVLFDTDSIDPLSVTSQGSVYDGKRTLLWTPTQHSVLNAIEPHATGEHTFTFKLKKTGTLAHRDSIRLIPFASYVTEGIQNKNEIHGDVLTVPITTPLSLMAFGRYYTHEGEQLGRGPLPPIVGRSTRYHIFLTPEGIVRPLKNVVLTARIAPHASWTGIVPLGGEHISYDHQSKTITWAVDSLTRDDEELHNGIVFEVSLTPLEEDIGKELPLLTDILLKAEDATTNTPMESSAEIITTRLIHDQKAASLWSVQK